MKRKISFTFCERNYEVDMTASVLDQIVLPDGTLLHVDGWFESLPPKPKGLTVIPHLLMGEKPAYIAELMKAAVATEVA